MPSMIMRKLKKKTILLKAIIYRPLIIILQTIVTFIYYHVRGRNVDNLRLAVEVSVVWNIINFAVYYLYDIAFLSLFKAGEE